MAVTLNIELNDAEQARILEIASVVRPGATPAQIKAWLEKKAKEALRHIVVMEWNDHQNKAMLQDWPEETLQTPPPQTP